MHGSSPQARGARRPDPERRGRAGLIPAGAGSTGPFRPGQTGSGAHPRRRGEHSASPPVIAHLMGSSPQARGAHVGFLLNFAVLGLIPAGAGSTTDSGSRSCNTRAHPRRRGEHLMPSFVLLNADGSSPQARGAHRLRLVRVRGEGLIPAGAGSTWWGVSPWASSGAHPRRRGEHWCWSFLVGGEVGSSPQARGARTWGSTWTTPARLIPAGAGSTPAGTSPWTRCRAHPRRRGEHASALFTSRVV